VCAFCGKIVVEAHRVKQWHHLSANGVTSEKNEVTLMNQIRQDTGGVTQLMVIQSQAHRKAKQWMSI
jgi:hypothetical protein